MKHRILIEKVKDTKNYSRYEVVSGGFIGHLYLPLDSEPIGTQVLIGEVENAVAK